MLSALECYEIAMPEFVVFRARLGSALKNLLPPIAEFNLLAGLLASPKVNVMPWPPNPDDVNRLENLGEKVRSITLDLQGDVIDLGKAAQNYLLGGLFPDHKISPRQPGDPNLKVTTIPISQG